MSLKTKISILIALCFTGVGAISTYLLISTITEGIEKEIIARGLSLSFSLSKAAEEGIATETLSLINKSSHVVQSDEVHFAQVYSTIWHALDAFPAEQLETPPDPRALTHFNNSQERFISKNPSYYDFYTPVIVRPFSNAPPMVIGFARLALSVEEMHESVRTSAFRYLMLSTMLTIMAIVICNRYLDRLVISPVVNLHNAITAFKEGRMPDVPSRQSRDEIGSLVGEFLTMSLAVRDREEKLRQERKTVEERTMLLVVAQDQLEARNELLQELNNSLSNEVATRTQAEVELSIAHNELENRVEERTAELSAANEQLRREITERIRIEAQLTAFTTILERSNRDLEDFAYIASHDLQEPLRKITVFGDRLKTKYAAVLDDQGNDYLFRMQSAASRMQLFITDLLSYSRVTTKALPFSPVDLNTVLTEVLSDLEIRLEQTGGRVENAGLATIDADPLQMRQLIQNLLGNALKFHKPTVAPIILVSGEIIQEKTETSNHPMYRITIKDNGIGFDNKYAERIFGIFQRLHGRSDYEGSGVGLAVCRKIVERHGGSIVAQGILDQGATFVVTLPYKQQSEVT